MFIRLLLIFSKTCVSLGLGSLSVTTLDLFFIIFMVLKHLNKMYSFIDLACFLPTESFLV